MIITPEELEALDPKKTRTIDIEDFVDLDEIDPLYYEHPYYLVPDTGAAKAYRLLLDALRDTNKVAIARVVLRSKEYLTAIRPAGDVLTMETMLFADELVPSDRLDELPDDDTRATDRELAMARQLIESQATEFDPSKYRDEYRERVLDLIERKAQGEDVSVQPDVEEPTEVPDLMAALEASLAAAGSKPPATNGASKAKKAPRRRLPAKKPPRRRLPAKKPRRAHEAREGRLPLLVALEPALQLEGVAHGVRAPVVVEVRVDVDGAAPLRDPPPPRLELGLRVVAVAPARAVVEPHEGPVGRELVRLERALGVVADHECGVAPRSAA